MDKTNDMRNIEDDNFSEDVAPAASATRLLYDQQMKEYERLQALQHRRAKQENPSGGRSEENISLKPLSTDVCISHQQQSESSTSNNKFSSEHLLSSAYELQRREYQRLNQAHNLRNSMRSQPQNNLASSAASSTGTTSQYANLITDEQLKYYQDIFDNATSLSSTGATATRYQTSSTQQQYPLEKDLSSYADNNANANGEHKEVQLKSPPEMLMRRNRKGFE